MATMVLWCSSRSSRLTAVVCSGRNRPHCSKGQWLATARLGVRRRRAHEPEQQLGAVVVQRGEADLIDDDELVAQQRLDESADAVVREAAVEGLDELGGGEVPDAWPAATAEWPSVIRVWLLPVPAGPTRVRFSAARIHFRLVGRPRSVAGCCWRRGRTAAIGTSRPGLAGEYCSSGRLAVTGSSITRASSVGCTWGTPVLAARIDRTSAALHPPNATARSSVASSASRPCAASS